MSKLEDFLGLTDVTEIRETVKERIGGKVYEFVVRPLTQEEHGEFFRRATARSKGGSLFDSAKYNALTLEACVVEPNFKSAEFLKKAGCQTADEFWRRKFPAGVISDLASKIQALSGFESMEAKIEEAKN